MHDQPGSTCLTLAPDQTLVPFEWLSRTDAATDGFAQLVDDQAEQRVLWNVLAQLEAAVPDALHAAYAARLAEARARVRD